MLPWHQYALGFIFIFAGFMHLQKSDIYLKILPPYLPSHKTVVLLSGILEMIFGMFILIPNYQKVGAWAWIVMLILFLPVHVYMLQNKKASLKLPTWFLVLRIPLQFLLIYWVYQYV